MDSLDVTELNDPSERLLLFQDLKESGNPSSVMLKLLCREPNGIGTVNEEFVEDEDEKSETSMVDKVDGEILADTDKGEDSPGTKVESEESVSCT